MVDLKKMQKEIKKRTNVVRRLTMKDDKKALVLFSGGKDSQSCCVNYIYTNHGMETRKGLFMDKLCKKIEDLDIPIIGIINK